MSLDQIQDIYRIYQVNFYIFFLFSSPDTSQVDFDIKFVSKYVNADGDITKDDFIKIATETKLTDFQGTKPGVVMTRGENGERQEIKVHSIFIKGL